MASIYDLASNYDVAEPGIRLPVAEAPIAQPQSALVAQAPAGAGVVAGGDSQLLDLLGKYMSQDEGYGAELKTARESVAKESQAFQDMIKKAMETKGEEGPSKAEMYFRLAAAFGAPTKTGSFIESLGSAGSAASEMLKERRESQKSARAANLQLGLEAQKLRMQGAKEDLTTLRQLASEGMKDRRAMVLEYLKSGRPQSEAGKLAIDAGLKQGTPEYANFVNQYVKQKIESGDLYKQAMLAVSQGNLTLQQEKEARAREQASKLTPAEVKLKSEAETALGGIDDAMGSLKRAYALNPNTFEGTLVDLAQLKTLEQTNPKDPRVLATREQKNLLSKGAISNLRATFGGNPTEGERNALLDLEGIDSKSKEERARIMKNTYRLLQARRDREQKRLNEITQGLYRSTSEAGGAGGIE